MRNAVPQTYGNNAAAITHENIADLMEHLDKPMVLPREQDNEEAYIESYFQNEYDGRLNVECGSHDALYRVISEHRNHNEDRRWRWECRRVSLTCA